MACLMNLPVLVGLAQGSLFLIVGLLLLPLLIPLSLVLMGMFTVWLVLVMDPARVTPLLKDLRELLTTIEAQFAWKVRT